MTSTHAAALGLQDFGIRVYLFKVPDQGHRGLLFGVTA